MEEWKEYKLGDVCSISSSKRIFANEYQLSGIPFYRGKEIIEKQKGAQITNELYISEERFNEIKDKYGTPHKGDMLLTSVGTLGIPYIVKDEKFYFKDGNLTWFYNFKGINNIYLYYWFLSPAAQYLINAKAIGSTQKALTIETLKKFDILLPTIDVQDQIASILKSLDDKIEVNRRINENLEQQAQALFKSWFVDFEPFKDGEFVESELGMIPKGWKVESLTRFGKIVCGKTPSKAESTYYGGNIPFIKIPDMHNNVFVLQSEDCLSELGDMSQIGKRIPPYSVLVSCIATVGLVGMNVRTCHTNQQINSIIPNSPKYRYYLYQKLVTLKDYINNLGRGGTATLNVNTRQFGSIEIIKPSDNVLSDYHQKVSCLFDKIKAISKESRRLATLRDTLLPKLMSGELKVNDVD